MGSASVYQRERGTCFSRRFGRWEPGPVGGMGVGFGEGALGNVSIFAASFFLYWRAAVFVVTHPRASKACFRVAEGLLQLCLLVACYALRVN